MVTKAMEEASKQPKGSKEAAVAWEIVEELDAELSHAMKKRAPQVAKTMYFVEKKILSYYDTHEIPV